MKATEFNSLMKAVADPSLSMNQLSAIRDAASDAMSKAREAAKHAAVAQIEKQAAESGFSVAELLSAARAAKSASSGQVYINPDNPDERWGGRGRRPSWFSNLDKAGRHPIVQSA